MLLTADIFFVYVLFKKDTKIKKRSNILKKMNSLKKGEGVPLLNFEGGPGVLLLNFEVGPGSHFKFLRGGSRVLGPRFPRSRVPGSWSHFYTLPEGTLKSYFVNYRQDVNMNKQ